MGLRLMLTLAPPYFEENSEVFLKKFLGTPKYNVLGETPPKRGNGGKYYRLCWWTNVQEIAVKYFRTNLKKIGEESRPV